MSTFILFSNNESISNKKISIVAILEVILINVIYWWFAISYDTYIHILVSVILTPFLLLKSKLSVDKTLDFLHKNLKYFDTFNFTKKKFYSYIFTIAIVVILLSTNNNILMFLTLLSLLSFLVYASFKHMQLRILVEVVFIFGAIFFTGMLFEYIDNTLKLDLNIFLEIILISIIFIFGGILLLLFSFAFLFIFSILIFKLTATTMYLNHGVQNIIDNWKESVFVIDSFKIPELIIGIEEDKRIHEYFKFSKY